MAILSPKDHRGAPQKPSDDPKTNGHRMLRKRKIFVRDELLFYFNYKRAISHSPISVRCPRTQCFSSVAEFNARGVGTMTPVRSARRRFLPDLYAIAAISYALLMPSNLEWRPVIEGHRYGRFVSAVVDRIGRFDRGFPAPLRASGGQAVIVVVTVATMAATLTGLYFALCKNGAKR